VELIKSTGTARARPFSTALVPPLRPYLLSRYSDRKKSTPKSKSSAVMPEKKDVSSMADFFSNIFFMDFRYSDIFCFDRLDSGSLTRNHSAITMGTTTAGKNRKVAYQAISPISAPKMGLNTFPKPLAASITPRDLLLSLPAKRSPQRAMAMGAVPAAPIPCNTRPASITLNEPWARNKAPRPATIPPSP